MVNVMKHNKTIELLAPAGSWEALEAAGGTPGQMPFTWAAKPLAHASMPAILTEKN